MVESQFLSIPACKRKKTIAKTVVVHIINFDVPLFSSTTDTPVDSIRLESDRPYTVGRSRLVCDFFINNRMVSKQHCQFLYDSKNRKIYILDGIIMVESGFSNFVVNEFRKRLPCADGLGKEIEGGDFGNAKGSLNGVFFNGVRTRSGTVLELSVGDEILLACGRGGSCGLQVQIGFMIQGIIFEEKIVSVPNEMDEDRCQPLGALISSRRSKGSISSGKGNKRVFVLREDDITSPVTKICGPELLDIYGRMISFRSRCRDILHSDDPISCIQQCANLEYGKKSSCGDAYTQPPEVNQDIISFRVGLENVDSKYRKTKLSSDVRVSDLPNTSVTLDAVDVLKTINGSVDVAHKDGDSLVGNVVASHVISFFNLGCGQIPANHFNKVESSQSCQLSLGKKFYLNRLQFFEQGFLDHDCVSLRELLHPVESILQMFVATFTFDIKWFFSYCGLPCHLPVTVACHSSEKCWNPSLDERIIKPYPQFPNLVLVFPLFPEAIAFGNDQKKRGVACHHPKLLILQRGNSIRVIITSANLVASQWNRVSNTVWWQDFPRMGKPEYASLFPHYPGEEGNQDSRQDFAAQLAGFVASLLVDVPSQAQWVIELAKYDFRDATGHLVASVPGVYSYQLTETFYLKHILGCVEASVVGLNHLFRSSADTKGIELKRLASFLANSRVNSFGMVEVVLRRDINVAADANAVRILVSNPDHLRSDGVQLGFLPRGVAKWVSPLWDIGFFRFVGHVYRDEAIGAASGRINHKMQLLLHVIQGPSFSDIAKLIQPTHVAALSSLVASMKRCIGIQRLQEVVSRYNWPESQESDFIYSASSIGSSISASFVAAFSAAAGKKTLQHFDSQESDPEWGCWNSSQERKSPSIKIVFPTIDRAKKAYGGLLSSRQILCFPEKTWLKLRELNMLHDAVPSPGKRIGFPMHVKVARRRFVSPKTGSSFGWVYCGSHNFSAAAWGRLISRQSSHNSSSSPNASYLVSRLHVCNYELGIIFIVPPPEATNKYNNTTENLDDIELPIVVPAPKYGPEDRPATKLAMREALAEQTKELENFIDLQVSEETLDENADEDEEAFEANDYIAEEKEEERAYAETLWSQSF